MNDSFVINYADGTQLIAKPASWAKLDDIETLQLAILKEAYAKSFCLGDIFRYSNKVFWDNATKLAKLLPIVGQEAPGFDPKKIEDANELCSIFITTTRERNPKVGSVSIAELSSAPEPSHISRIHYLNFIRLLIQVEEQSQEKKSS